MSFSQKIFVRPIVSSCIRITVQVTVQGVYECPGYVLMSLVVCNPSHPNLSTLVKFLLVHLFHLKMCLCLLINWFQVETFNRTSFVCLEIIWNAHTCLSKFTFQLYFQRQRNIWNAHTCNIELRK